MIITEAELRLMLAMKGDVGAEERMILQQMHGEAESLVKEYIFYDPEQQTHVEYYPANDPSGGLSTEYEQPLQYSESLMAPTRKSQFDLQLRHVPVRKILSIRQHPLGRFGTTDHLLDQFDDLGNPVANVNELTLGTDYWVEYQKLNLCRSGAVFSAGSWSEEPGSIRVEYVAGYSPSELSGRADTDAAGVDEAVGLYTCPGLSAAAIKRAVVLTVAKGMHTQQNFRRTNDGNNVGFSGGGTFQSERLQDYAYTRPSNDTATNQLTGLILALPSEAMQALSTFRHYGVMAF